MTVGPGDVRQAQPEAIAAPKHVFVAKSDPAHIVACRRPRALQDPLQRRKKTVGSVMTRRINRDAPVPLQVCGAGGRAAVGWRGGAAGALRGRCAPEAERTAPDMIGWSRVLLGHTLDAARSY